MNAYTYTHTYIHTNIIRIHTYTVLAALPAASLGDICVCQHAGLERRGEGSTYTRRLRREAGVQGLDVFHTERDSINRRFSFLKCPTLSNRPCRLDRCGTKRLRAACGTKRLRAACRRVRIFCLSIARRGGGGGGMLWLSVAMRAPAAQRRVAV